MGQRVIRAGKRIKSQERRKRGQEIQGEFSGIDGRYELIQLLIPLGLKAVEEELQREVEQLVGCRTNRSTENRRWGKNPGSVYLGDQKVRIKVPRVRDTVLRQEVPLQSYQTFRQTKVLDHQVLHRVINGISQRQYEQAALCVPETFGIKKSSNAVLNMKKNCTQVVSGMDLVNLVHQPFSIFKLLFQDETSSLLGISIHEGRKRQIKRMCAAINHPVLNLKRIQLAFLSLQDIEEGKYRLLSSQEVEALKKCAGAV